MKRTIALWLGLPAAAGLLAFALSSALAQTPTAVLMPQRPRVKFTASLPVLTIIRPRPPARSPSRPRAAKKGTTNSRSRRPALYEGELPAGAYSARVMMQDQSGFAEYTKTDVEVTVTAGQDLQQDIDLGNLVAAAPPIKGPSGSIHGRVIGPTGDITAAGTVSLSVDGGPTAKYSFPVSPDGSYSGVASPGKYTLVFRAPNTPANKVIDQINDIKIVAGQDLAQDDDMSRKEYLDKLTPDQKKQIEEIKKNNAAVMQQNAVVKNINADIKVVVQDFSDAVSSKDPAVKIAKYQDAETIMLKDTAAKPDASTLWAQLGQAQAGLGTAQNDTKKYDEAITSLKKSLEMEAVAKKPSGIIQAAAYSALGEIYARTGKIPDANAAFDAAAKANPILAPIYPEERSCDLLPGGQSRGPGSCRGRGYQGRS